MQLTGYSIHWSPGTCRCAGYFRSFLPSLSSGFMRRGLDKWSCTAQARSQPAARRVKAANSPSRSRCSCDPVQRRELKPQPCLKAQCRPAQGLLRGLRLDFGTRCHSESALVEVEEALLLVDLFLVHFP